MPLLASPAGLLASTSDQPAPTPTSGSSTSASSAPALTVAHITDVHITGEGSAAGKFKKCLEEIRRRHKPDFFLNGGDSVMDVSYNNVKREQVYSLWKVWDECTSVIKDHEVFSCIGNHDSWWAAPSKEDEMYGKAYAVKRLAIPDRYYSFSRKGWHFVILDGNNDNISLDQQQYDWLMSDLERLPAGTPTLLMSHYPILGVTPLWEGGGHADCKKLKSLFYKHKDKVKVCLSGHIHLQDRNWYNGVAYFCNGAVSGFWWGRGDEHSAAPYYYEETAPGYAILKLYADGTVENEYHTPGCLVE